MKPFDAGMLAWRTAFVFTSRSLALWAQPATASRDLTAYALEKQRAFAQGALDAALLAQRGATPARIAAAALAPAGRRVKANAKKLGR